MRNIYWLLVGLLLIPVGCTGPYTPPNILVIISDQHSGLLMNQTGYQYLDTPGINKIAEQGVTFTRSYCTYPVCVAARASFMTGMMPSKSSGNLTSYKSIGKTMLDAGYETAYFGKWHVGRSKMDKVSDWHGFETYQDLRRDTKTKELTVDFLKQDRERPFFLMTSFLNPHDCCELARNIAGLGDDYRDGPVEEHMDLEFCPPLPANFDIPPDEAEGFSTRRLPDSSDHTNYGKHPVKYWTETEWRQYMYGYDRLVEKVDAHILDVMNTLEAEGLLENTLVIYTSDHGDGHASHQWNQKMTFYEESINIPFIVSWKGHTIAGRIDEETLVSNGLDMYPTICKIAGVSWPEVLPGADLSPFYLKDADPTTGREYVVSEINQTARYEDGNVVLKGRMVVSENYKYILFDGGENREQFFDVKKDPGEMNPVTMNPDYQEQLSIHRQYLKEWIVATSDDFLTENIPQDPVVAAIK
ncbi:MAG TPA: DUF229 domain-containing protein [Bacteroides sp.]|nr:DUF229 domain-containing protein [Bacteroides sp.]